MASPRVVIGTGWGLALVMALAFLVVLGRVVHIATGPLAPQPGQVAPSFEGATTEGRAVQLESLRGQVVLLDFWATWCGPCVASLPHLDQLHRELEGEPFTLVGINVEPHAKDHVRRFLAAHDIGFPSVFDEEGAISASYGVYSYPTTYLLDVDGTVLHAYRGSPPVERIRRGILAALDAAASGPTGR
jgi:peroxiredoxin